MSNNRRLRRMKARVYVAKKKRSELYLQQANGNTNPQIEAEIQRLNEVIEWRKLKCERIKLEHYLGEQIF